ncbi:MAG: isoprenyl transferase [Oscillospiraceae bacterium]|nr:isoprenyl transferase [Oscillospiraceae bacterium]
MKLNSSSKLNFPKHLAIIMDGNGRWAKKKHSTRSFGHRFGVEKFKSVAKYCGKIGIGHLSVFAFSTENWKRPPEEVKFIMGLFEEYLSKALSEFQGENFRVNFLGGKTLLSEKIRNLIARAERETKSCTGMVLNIAANYGSKDEITRAVKEIAKKVEAGQISIDQIDETLISQNLYTDGQPDVDLVIRTGEEKRISNFLLWQSAYAEYIFLDTLWPDFKLEFIDDAIREFSSRKRRFGGIAIDS